jgi:hypothetical protein
MGFLMGGTPLRITRSMVADQGVIRPANLHDAEACTELNRLIMPYEIVTPAGFRHWWQSETEAAKLLALVTEFKGEVVGAGHARLNTWASEEGASSLSVMVHPDHRRRGIGR